MMDVLHLSKIVSACKISSRLLSVDGGAMFQTFDQAQKYVNDYNIEMVDLSFVTYGVDGTISPFRRANLCLN